MVFFSNPSQRLLATELYFILFEQDVYITVGHHGASPREISGLDTLDPTESARNTGKGDESGS